MEPVSKPAGGRASAAAAGVTPADTRTWSARAGFIGPEVARRIAADPRIAQLSIEATGLLLLLQVRTVAGLPSPSDPKKAARLFNLPARAWKSTLAELTESVPPLASDDGTMVVAHALGPAVPAELSAKRSLAAKSRDYQRGRTAAAPPATAPTSGANVVPLAAHASLSAPQAVAPAVAPAVRFGPRPAPPIAPAPVREAAPAVPAAPALPAAPPGPVMGTPARAAAEVSGQVQLSLDGMPAPPEAPAKPARAARAARPEIGMTPQQVATLYCDICVDLAPVSDIKQWPASRTKALKARINENPEQDWNEFFGRVHRSDWLCGRADGSNGWKANFDWLLKPANFIRVIEGAFSGGTAPARLFGRGGKSSAGQYQEAGAVGDDDFMRIAAERRMRGPGGQGGQGGRP